MLPNLYAKMPWDIVKDFEPVSLVAADVAAGQVPVAFQGLARRR